MRRFVRGVLGSVVILAATTTVAGASSPAPASPSAAIDANPEVSNYQCGLMWFNKTWTVAAAGIYWNVTYGDGQSSGNQSISAKSIGHTFNPMGACIDYAQMFRAHDSLGGTASDATRVVYSN